MVHLLEYLAGDCKWRRPRHSYHKDCGAFFCHLGPGKPPPNFPGMILFRPRKVDD
jgi:hypothetical protein